MGVHPRDSANLCEALGPPCLLMDHWSQHSLASGDTASSDGPREHFLTHPWARQGYFSCAAQNTIAEIRELFPMSHLRVMKASRHKKGTNHTRPTWNWLCRSRNICLKMVIAVKHFMGWNSAGSCSRMSHHLTAHVCFFVFFWNNFHLLWLKDLTHTASVAVTWMLRLVLNCFKVLYLLNQNRVCI